MVDESGKVRAIDFDEMIEFYDPYYCYGYFCVSLERAKFKGELQKYVLENMDFSQNEAEYRFKLGVVAAMSNHLRIAAFNKDAELAEKRLGEIYGVMRG